MNGCADMVGERLADYDHESCLIYGIGNVGRQDDGLGWAFIDWLEESGVCPRADIARHYQLQLEDADLISHKQRVLFVDATKAADVEGIRLESLTSKMDFSFTSHAISIPAIMATCQHCFDRLPQVQLLTMKGFEWGLQIGLTEKATQNLNSAKELFNAFRV